MRLLTEDEVALQLAVSKVTLGRIRRRGEIAHRKIGNQVRYIQADVDEYVARSRVAASAPGERAPQLGRYPTDIDREISRRVTMSIIGQPRKPRKKAAVEL